MGATITTPLPSLNITDVLKAFLAGVVGVLVFQFGLATILYLAGWAPGMPYSLRPVPPLGVPQSLSSAFWGGLWGIVLLLVLRRAASPARYWLTAVLFGGIVVSAVLLFVVFPLKSRPFAAGWDMGIWARIFLLHAAFGLGTAAVLAWTGATRPR